MGFTRSEEIINSIRKELKLDSEIYALMKIWDSEFSPLFPYAELTGISRGIIVIEVESSVQLQELSMRRGEITKKINHYFGKKGVVKDIKIRIKTNPS